MKILFMGTPEFAAESLRTLLNSAYDICGIFTQPDKPKGRGMEVEFSPVKSIALENNIPVFQPAKLRDGTAMELVRNLEPDIIVVVAYGRIIPDDILYYPRLGTINVHGSLLPAFRGASPIQTAVLSGEKISGVTTMYLATEMDSGDIIYSDMLEIADYETSGEYSLRLQKTGAELLLKTLKAIEAGTAPRIPQDHSKATYTKMLDKSMSPIDFNRSAHLVIRQIYGLQPWPVATLKLNGDTVKVYGAEYSSDVTNREPGKLLRADERGLLYSCACGETVIINEIQVPGKKRVKVCDYLCGHSVAADL